MSLRVALVIEGDSKGAKQALDETSKSLDGLRDKAGGAAENTSAAASAAGDLRDNAGGVAKETGNAAAALGRIETEAAAAARALGKADQAAQKASGRFGMVAGALAGLASGLVIGAIVSGLAAATSEVVGFISTIGDHSAEIEGALGRQESLIKRISAEYKRAASGASNYGRESAAALRFEQQQNIRQIDPLFQREAEDAASSLAGINRIVDFEVYDDLGPFTKAVGDLRTAVAEGRPDINAFRQEIALIAGTLSENDPFIGVAESMLSVTDRAGEMQSNLARARDALAGLEGDTGAASNALGGLPKQFDDIGASAERSAASVAAFKAQLAGLGPDGGAQVAEAGGAAPASPFAAGGVVDRPTFFMFGAGGRLGLMGEAGPEAIMPLSGGRVGAVDVGGRQGSLPLARMAGGKLGVRAMPFASGGVTGAFSGDGGGFGVTASGAAGAGAGSLGTLSADFAALGVQIDGVTAKLATGSAAWSNYRSKGDDASKQMQGQWTASLQASVGQIQGFTGALASESDKWSKINKAAGIANALISTYRGAAKALELGPIIGPIMAAATVATGLAYVAQIASSGSGGTGGAVSAASPVGTGAFAGSPPGAAAAQAGPTQNIAIYGTPSEDVIEELVRRVNDHAKNGGQTFLTRGEL